MKIAGVVISSFENNYKSGPESIRKVFKKTGIPVIKEYSSSLENNFLLDLKDSADDYDAVALGYSDSEFYSFNENKRLVDEFNRYQPDIGFSDNYPSGVIFEIVRCEILEIMNNLFKGHGLSMGRNLITDIINLDVNLFDLENLPSKVNLRTLRLNFFSDNQQDLFTIKKIKSFLASNIDLVETDFEQIGESILSNRDQLRTIPKYFEISLTNQVVQPSLFLPEQENKEINHLGLDEYKVILNKILSFSHQPVIAFSGFGEMTANPEWRQIVRFTLEQKVECILETTGVFWSNELSEEMSKWPNFDRLTIIFLVDTIDRELYQKIRVSEYSLEVILEKIEYILLRYGSKVYVQATKTNETFYHLNEFYEHFKKLTKNIIIYKYNTFRGKIAERRTEPIEPFEKIDCWHLKRGLKIDEAGRVWLCKQDLEKEHALGNLITDDIKEIYDRGESYFIKQVKGWDFCKGCDEYYTYNY